MAHRGQNPQAIKVLENITKQKFASAVTVEASIELALLYAETQRPKDASAMLDAADAFLEQAASNGLTEDLQKAFVQGVSQARKSIKNPGRSLFELARGMQRETKYARAIALFDQLSQDFPTSDYAQRANLEIGSCHLALGRQPEAIEQWRQFIAASPAGPWRGHAFVCLIDVQLAERLDLSQADSYAQQAKAAMPNAFGDKQAKASWKKAAYDLHLRIGMVNLCLNRHDVAVEAFKQARATAPDRETKNRLDILIAAAPSESGIIPIDCGVSVPAGNPKTPNATLARRDAESARVALALSLGMIHHLAGQHDLAEGYFDRVIGTPAVSAARGVRARPAMKGLPGAKPSQLAFAAFGKGAVLHTEGKTGEAQDAFLASIQAYTDGSWHDETLYRLAMIVEEQAKKQYSHALKKLNEKDDRKNPKDDITLAEREARQQLLTTLIESKAEAMPYWQQLIERYPDSPRRELALYHSGVLHYTQAETMSVNAASKAAGNLRTTVSGVQIEQAWRRAAGVFNKLSEVYPNSPYAGEAYVKQIDIALERRFDVDAAAAVTQQAVTWAQQATRGQLEAASPSLPAWAGATPRVRDDSLHAQAFDIYVMAGLIAHLQRRNEQAVAMFREANRFDQSLRRRSGAETAMDRMITVAQGLRSSLSPQDLMDKLRNDKQRTAVLLADLALLTFDPERAESLYDRLLTGQPPFPAPSTELEAYLLLRMGQALEFQRRHEEAMAVLHRLYEPKYSRYPWAADGIFRIGTWSHNATQDPDAAMSHWQHVFTRNPDHPEAERSLFYFGITAMRNGEHRKAVEAFTEYLNRYPDSRWTQRIRERELPEAIRLLQETQR